MLRDYPLLRYGEWAGEPHGHPYRPARCAYEVFPHHGIQYQCTRPKGYGADELFCKQHARKVGSRA